MERQTPFCWIVLLFFCWNHWKTSADQCPMTEKRETFEEIGEYAENEYADFSYRLTDEISKNSEDLDFRIEIRLCESDSLYTACRCQWLYNTYPVCKSFRTEYVCEGDNSTMHLSMLIKRSQTAVKWIFFRQMSSPVVLKHTALHVTYPAKITGLLVNEEQSNRTHLVDQNKVVNISCFFSNGNPPVKIRMVNDSGDILNHEQGPLMMSLGVVHCQDVWPTIRCEARGSELNRSVTILVKCRPELSFITAEVPDVKRVLDGGMTFAMKSYTSDISRCLMNQEQPRTTMRKVKCQISGHAPNFTLTLDFVNNSWIGEGTWTLHVISEDWNSNITFLINNNTGKMKSNAESPSFVSTENSSRDDNSSGPAVKVQLSSSSTEPSSSPVDEDRVSLNS